jgi:predicted acylesterase/phospholipase RssA
VQDHDLLVDGGLMNRLPVDVMRGLCNGGKVLAVNVSTQQGLAAKDANIASILLWSTLVKSAQSQESLERDADVCVQVPHAPVSLLDFSSFDEIVEAGYRATLEQLRGNLELGQKLSRNSRAREHPRARDVIKGQKAGKYE